MCHRSTHDRIEGQCKQAKWLYLGLLLTMLAMCIPNMDALAQTPVLYYTLNENSGGGGENPFWADASGNGFNGSCPAGNCPNGGSPGISGTTAALYNTVDDYIRVPSPIATLKPTSTVAVSAWIKTNSTTADGGEIISMGDSYAMRLLNDGNLRFLFYVGNNVWSAVDTSGLALKDNAWHHVFGQKTTSGLQVYVDGALKNSISDTRPISYTLGTDFYVGKHGNGFFNRYFIGTIDDARVYTTTLSASQITALYSAGAAVRTDTGPLTSPAHFIQQGPSLNLQRWVKTTDPNFPGVTLVRVTDISDGSECHHSYSYWHVFNANNTNVLLSCDNGLYLYPFDPATQTFLPTQRQPLSISQTYINEWADITWSSVDPNVIFFHHRTKLYKLDIVNGGQQPILLRDFAAHVDPTSNGSNCMRQLSKADFQQGSRTVLGDDVFAFDIRDTCNDGIPAKGYVVWKSTPVPGGTVLKYLAPPTANPFMDEVRINKTGEHLFISHRTQADGNKVLNMSTGSTTTITDTDLERSVGHYDVGRPAGTPTGADVIGMGNRGQNTLGPGHMYHPFSNPKVPNTLHDYTWGSDYQIPHYSLLADNEQWVLVSQYGYEGVCTPPPGNVPLKDEIYQLSTNLSGAHQYRRIAHTRSLTPSCDYWSQPKAAINRDGRFIIWTSNMTNNGVTRRDVYMAIIPPAP